MVITTKRHIWKAWKYTVLRLIALLSLIPMVLGCATPQSPSSFNPKSINEVRFRDRSQSTFDNEVRVTAAVPTAEEIEALFGMNLAGKGIQPIWVKVENHSEHTFYLLSVGVDPNYFSAMEAAYTVGGGLVRSVHKDMENHFRSMNFRNPILPRKPPRQ